MAPSNETVLCIASLGLPAAVYPAGLILGTDGNLYGTAGGGPYDTGTVFKLDKAGNETLLYSFPSQKNGESPSNDLVQDMAGNL